ncbi:MAG: IS1634 family transposase [Planctomycetota bacterium]|jgi:transposase
MYVETVPNRGSRPAILLREGWREGRRVRKRTLANLSDWPPQKVEALRRLLRDEPLMAPSEAFAIQRSRPHGHVAAVLGTLKKLGLDRLLAARRGPERDCAVALIASRVLAPDSKLATARTLDAESATSTLGEMLGLETVEAEDLYAAMDWLEARQAKIEKALAKRHLHDGTLVLYDVSSSYFEGRTCPLAAIGHSRDGKKGSLQIVFGLLCNADGCPVAVEVYEGNTGDPTTLKDQIEKVRHRFGLSRVVFVGDRGLLTSARIREELAPVDGLDWVSALRAEQIRKLAEDGGPLQLSLFDRTDLAEIRQPDFPGERLIACFNPLLAAERARKREDLLQATERELEKVAAATRREKRALRGQDKIGLRVGKVLGRFKMAKHFEITITEAAFTYARKTEAIAAETRLDGLYVLRTSVSKKVLGAEDTVRAYKDLAKVERAFRCLKTVDLHVRPIHHRLEQRVRTHVFLCMLAYYVEWHMRRAWAPLLFAEDDPQRAAGRRGSPVQPAVRSQSAEDKASAKTTPDGETIHRFRGLLDHLATLTKNTIQPPGDLPAFDRLTVPTHLQQKAFDLLGLPIPV